MMKHIKIALLISLLALPFYKSYSQDEYVWEWGASIGGSYYMGDANWSKPFKHTGLAGGMMARRILNPHMAIKGNLSVGRISGNTNELKNAYPNNEQSEFKRIVFDLGAQFEYNFLGYGTNTYRGDKRFTPYIIGGIGLTFLPKPAKETFTINFPLGIGVKYKIAPRINIGCEYAIRFTLSDKLDVSSKEGMQLADPYQIKGKGFKNKDSYTFALFFITYDFGLKCRDCNN